MTLRHDNAMRLREDSMPGPIMTSREVAEYLQVHQSTLYKLIRRRQIPFFKIGSDYRFSREAIQDWIARRPEKEMLTPD